MLGDRLHALLVGIEGYPHPSLPRLHGCARDVAALRDLLVGGFGVPESQVLVLAEADATREGIEAAFADHLIAAGRRWAEHGAPDRPPAFLFAFSGHGSQARDPSGTEPDGMDETLVAYDGRNDDVYDIKDYELAGWLAQLPGDDVTVILDCCHSGSGARQAVSEPGEATRAAPPDLRPQPGRRPRQLGPTRGVSLAGAGRHVLLAACSDHQEAFELRAPDGTVRGAFSYFLVPVLEQVARGAPLTYRDVHDQVRFAVNAARPRQTPQCEGDVDRIVFGSQRRPREGSACVLGIRDAGVWFDVGRVHGVTPGSVLAVTPSAVGPGAAPQATVHGDDGGAPQAGGDGSGGQPAPAETRVAIEHVEPVRCAGPVLEGAALPARGAAARILRIDLGPRRVRVRLGSGCEPLVDPMTAALAGPLGGLVTETEAPEEADLQVTGGGNWQVTDAAGRLLVTVERVGDLLEALAHIARYAALLEQRRADLGPDLPGGVDVGVRVIGSDALTGMATAEEAPVDDAGRVLLRAGQRVAFALTNGTAVPLHAGLLAFTSDWHVTLLHPPAPGGQDRMAPGATVLVGTGQEALSATVPPDREESLDRLMLVATTAATSFEPLALTPPPGTWAPAAPLPDPAVPRADPEPERLLRQPGPHGVPSRWVTAARTVLTRA